MAANQSLAQRALVELALSRGVKEAKLFDPMSPWNVPLGVTAEEAVAAGIPFAFKLPPKCYPNQGILIQAGGMPCIYG